LPGCCLGPCAAAVASGCTAYWLSSVSVHLCAV
jgi:hypothetical protein